MITPKPPAPPPPPMTRVAKVAGWIVRILVGLGVGCWVGGYAIWLFCSKDLAKDIWAPMAWLIRNPPDATLAVLLGVVMLAALFFEPMHEFLMDLDEFLGMKRRQAQSTDTLPVDNPGDRGS